MVFGFDLPASLEQAAKVIGALGYDGIELAGFYDHATIERFRDKRNRERLACPSWARMQASADAQKFVAEVGH
jgi:sugar phosphate isomerase/epimerase